MVFKRSLICLTIILNLHLRGPYFSKHAGETATNGQMSSSGHVDLPSSSFLALVREEREILLQVLSHSLHARCGFCVCVDAQRDSNVAFQLSGTMLFLFCFLGKKQTNFF